MKDSITSWVIESLQKDIAPRIIQSKLIEHLENFKYREILPHYLAIRRQVADLGVVDFLRILEEIEERLYQIIQQKRVQPTPEEAHRIKQYLTIVEKEFSEIRPSGDRDFELYLQARKREDRAEARNIYTRLLNKYPDVDIRANLLRFWRKGRGLFHVLYLESRLALGEKLNQKIRTYIQTLVNAFAETGNQTLALMGSIRQATKILPPNKQVALSLLDKLLFYSNFLGWHAVEFQSIYNILKSFYEETLFQQRKISLVTESDASKKKTKVIQQIDLQKVKFTSEDLQMILVSPKIQGTTNLTLAYCRKYWLMVGDPIFENKILLYSQKYRTWHHSIYQTILRGKMMRQDDEVILMNVYNVISKSLPYDYDIRREFIMQMVWRKIKPQATTKKRPGEGDQNILQTKTEASSKKQKTAPEVKPSPPSRQKQLGSKPKKEKELAPKRPDKNPKTEKPKKEPRVNTKSEIQSREKPKFQQLPSSIAKSIMERILEIDQTEQKNLHLVFRRNLEIEIEKFIRTVGYLQKIDLKPYTISLATISIKNFILENMNSVNPNWLLSKERLEVQELGIVIDDVQPIIESCLKTLEGI